MYFFGYVVVSTLRYNIILLSHESWPLVKKTHFKNIINLQKISKIDVIRHVIFRPFSLTQYRKRLLSWYIFLIFSQKFLARWLRQRRNKLPDARDGANEFAIQSHGTFSFNLLNDDKFTVTDSHFIPGIHFVISKALTYLFQRFVCGFNITREYIVLWALKFNLFEDYYLLWKRPFHVMFNTFPTSSFC